MMDRIALTSSEGGMRFPQTKVGCWCEQKALASVRYCLRCFVSHSRCLLTLYSCHFHHQPVVRPQGSLLFDLKTDNHACHYIAIASTFLGESTPIDEKPDAISTTAAHFVHLLTSSSFFPNSSTLLSTTCSSLPSRHILAHYYGEYQKYPTNGRN